jgi:hypothetical protein
MAQRAIDLKGIPEPIARRLEVLAKMARQLAGTDQKPQRRTPAKFASRKGKGLCQNSPQQGAGAAVTSLGVLFMLPPMKSGGHGCGPYRAAAVARAIPPHSGVSVGARSSALRCAPGKSVAPTRHS